MEKYAYGFVIDCAGPLKESPVEQYNMQLGWAETVADSRKEFFEGFLFVYMFLIDANMRLGTTLGFQPYPGIHSYYGRKIP